MDFSKIPKWLLIILPGGVILYVLYRAVATADLVADSHEYGWGINLTNIGVLTSWTKKGIGADGNPWGSGGVLPFGFSFTSPTWWALFAVLIAPTFYLNLFSGTKNGLIQGGFFT